MPATLHVERSADRDVKCRFILLRVNGKQVGSILYGEKIDLELPPGHHEIVFDNTWAKKRLELDIGESEVYAIQVGNTASFFARLWMAVLAAFPTGIFVTMLRVDTILPAEDAMRSRYSG